MRHNLNLSTIYWCSLIVLSTFEIYAMAIYLVYKENLFVIGAIPALAFFTMKIVDYVMNQDRRSK